MSQVLIHNISTLATDPSADDFFAIDGPTNGTRKISALPSGIIILRSTVCNVGAGAGDIGTISVPAWITRYRILCTTGPSTVSGGVFSVSATGTLAALIVRVFDAASGGGNQVISNLTTTNLTAANLWQNFTSVSSASATYTASTLHVNSSVDSANAGTVKLYIPIIPLL